MEANKETKNFSQVHIDKQWVRRCKQEELNLIDSFNQHQSSNQHNQKQKRQKQ